MFFLDNNIVDKIAKKCLDLFENLPKNGKPIESEWTVLSCVVQCDVLSQCFEVVSMGTGTKCIGATKMSPAGDLLNDSHAEVIARRGFLLYLYDNIEKTLECKESIFSLHNNKFQLNENIEFVFYSSQLPCGDASIMPQFNNCTEDIENEQIGEVIQMNKRHAIDDGCEENTKKPKLNCDDIFRTGAKCLPHSVQDSKNPGKNYHLLGQVRTKPGRGDRTLSVSCSDKIARWIHTGIQGALLDILLHEPIFTLAFIFGGGVPYSEESLKRALLGRSSEFAMESVPRFYQSSVKFPFIKSGDTVRPAPGSIVYIQRNNLHHSTEVAVQGRKLGLTKKKAATPRSSMCISKYNLFWRFQSIFSKNNLGLDSIQNISYNEMKRKSERYNKKWDIVKKMFFKIWTVKPDIWSFKIDSNLIKK